ncbi:23S rRNA (uracil(1939)-C(5))-methyltransferase RlmD [bacterium]|nr:23S rRNA (uracil(1939)-C(5))-methyltransferase RlmD [bacterium]
MIIGEEIELKIEKIADSGDGIARHDGLVIFVENSCPEDILRVKITGVNKKWANAKIVEVLQPSQYRTDPFCPMQKVCGACQLQFIDYNYQLKIKKQIVEDAIHKIGGLDVEVKDVIPSPQIKSYRHKVQYPISQTKVSKRILAGYYKPKSHEVVNIKYCPIQPKICDEIIDFIRNRAFDFGISGFNEKKHSGDLRHVVLRVSKFTGEVLVVLVVNATKSFDRLNDFAKFIYDSFKEVCGVCVNFNSKKTNVILGTKTECIEGNGFIKEKVINKTFKIGASSFFQINPMTAENIFGFVKNYIEKNFENPIVMDAYAGISTFGIIVSDAAKKVVSVEENSEAVELAKETVAANNVKNVEIHKMDTQVFFENEKRKFDIVILDPPRKGCTKETLESVLRITKGKVIYVSCNPATLARDLKYLSEKGAKVEFVQPFDMFCHTVHVESVAIVNIL